MTSWPSELKINQTGYKDKPPNRVIKSSMDVGPGKIRRRSSNAIRPVSFTLNLTQAQYEILDAFYIANDAFAFDFTNPRTNTQERARFTEVPDPVVKGDRFEVSVKLEILP